jgi:hypothetical protein
MSDAGKKSFKAARSNAGPTYMVFGKDMSAEEIASALNAEARRQKAAVVASSGAKSTALVAGLGQLDICSLCDSSPHEVGCPNHPNFDDQRCS